MKKKHKRLLSLFLSLVMMIVSVPVISEPLEAHAALYPYLDYSRIYGSKNAQSYDVEVSFGSMMVEGKLRHTGDYSQNQIDIAISKVLEMNGLNESDLLYAQREIEKWEKQQEITTKDYMEICANIANIMGVGEPFDMANNLYKVFIEGQGCLGHIQLPNHSQSSKCRRMTNGFPYHRQGCFQGCFPLAEHGLLLQIRGLSAPYRQAPVCLPL